MSEAKRDSTAPAWLDPVVKAGLQAWTIYRGTARGKISLALVVGGVAIISGNWIKAFVSSAQEVVFNKPITFPEVSPFYGVLLVALGTGFYIWTARDERRVAAAVARPTVATIRHESMEAVTQPLRASALPSDLASADIHPFEINQSSFYANGVLTASDAAAAVRVQADLIHRVRTLLSAKPAAEIIYYGKAHIPLVFLAGHSLSTGAPIRLYELGRQGGEWWAIDEASEGDDLDLRIDRSEENKDCSDALIRVSVSYPVHGSDVAEALRRPYGDVHISIPEPHVDAIRTRHQIEAVARAFRKVLDELKAREPGPSRIHVFYSGPMSLAFCLGRQISPTIHPPVFVYNFTAKTTPKYAWALHVNGQGSAESLILPTLPAAA